MFEMSPICKVCIHADGFALNGNLCAKFIDGIPDEYPGGWDCPHAEGKNEKGKRYVALMKSLIKSK